MKKTLKKCSTCKTKRNIFMFVKNGRIYKTCYKCLEKKKKLPKKYFYQEMRGDPAVPLLLKNFDFKLF